MRSASSPIVAIQAIYPSYMPMHISNYTPLLLILVRTMTVETVNEAHAWVDEAYACFQEDTSGPVLASSTQTWCTAKIPATFACTSSRPNERVYVKYPTTKWTCIVELCLQGQAIPSLTRIKVLNKKPCLPQLVLAAKAQPVALLCPQTITIIKLENKRAITSAVNPHHNKVVRA